MAKELCRWCVKTERKAYLIMIFVQFIYAGMAMLSKAAISRGMSPFVFVAFRQAFATLSLLPFAFFLHRDKKADPLSCRILGKIFFVSLIGISLSLNLYAYAMNYVTATFASASINTIPALTFLIAMILRIERSVAIRELAGFLKVVGSGLSLSGAMLFAFGKGPLLKPLNLHSFHHQMNSPTTHPTVNRHDQSNYKWIQGCLLMLAANTTWASWLVMQAHLVKQYPAKVRLTLLQCLCSCIQTTIWGLAMERNMSSWRPHWDMNLFSVAYCGVIVTGVCYWLQVWSVEKKGPLFTATFTPLALIITAILSAFLWNETLHLGSLCGMTLLVGGLYFVLWGKNREPKQEPNNDDGEEKEEDTTDV
ncbi:WAT1-related protein At1g43650-like [Andrographis paniculata]|uniref:WAT1-related protein At1g43650-like n=1 Tax=Andrographis paniculata TaxID=175694 RepID=UPI0021E872A1|nr:WAT1-related protein At1g43650-like [Andrographis paniculata]